MMINRVILIPNQLEIATHHCPHPQPFSLGEKGARFRVPLLKREGFRVRADWYQLLIDLVLDRLTQSGDLALSPIHPKTVSMNI
jgi:hypothetical protein